MDFLYYVFVLLNEALRSFSNCILAYGADVSVCLLWIVTAIFSFNHFLYIDLTTPLSSFVNRELKKGKYLNEGATLHKIWKMKQVWMLGRLLVEVEDNNADRICFDVARVIFENSVGIKFNWDYRVDLLSMNPLKARQARRAFIGEGNWDKFKETFTAAGRRRLYKVAAKL